ncbi:Tetraspanin, partial [Cynara cardunculus var. scolymus]
MTMLMRSCTQSLLKLVNSFTGMCGFATILYALWMIRIWHRQANDSYHPASWYYTFHIFLYSFYESVSFMYTILGLGAILCAITCWGHIAAETANGCCLYFYLVFVLLILILEGAVTMDVFLNPKWEEDFPQDPSGNFHKLKDFMKENVDMCKWVGLSILSVQGLSMVLALILIALGPHRISYNNDDEYTPEGVPLLKNYSNQSPCVYGSKIDAWN